MASWSGSTAESAGLGTSDATAASSAEASWAVAIAPGVTVLPVASAPGLPGAGAILRLPAPVEAAAPRCPWAGGMLAWTAANTAARSPAAAAADRVVIWAPAGGSGLAPMASRYDEERVRLLAMATEGESGSATTAEREAGGTGIPSRCRVCVRE